MRSLSSADAERVAPPQLHRSFFARDVVQVARDLIGAILLVDNVGGVIVETEAYASDDPASHSYVGVTQRNSTMFGPPGHAYVYRSYGVHRCLSFVCGRGSAILVRALEPTCGTDIMTKRRGGRDLRLLCSGPGRVCQALHVTMAHNGLAVDQPPFSIMVPATPPVVGQGTRIGITKAADLPWRFVSQGSRFVSRPMRSVELGA
jgi:DNA-3-methyladenine glycosylase